MNPDVPGFRFWDRIEQIWSRLGCKLLKRWRRGTEPNRFALRLAIPFQTSLAGGCILNLTATELARIRRQGLHISEKCGPCGKLPNQTVRRTFA
jgi:hypothetical protein